MRGSPSDDYVVGVDGLPLGTHAAAARLGEVTATFSVLVNGQPCRPLDQRVREAIAVARSELGNNPTEVRLICVDDGTDGSALAAVSEWLEQERISFQVLDLVRNSTADLVPELDDDAQSLERAIEAALWS